MGARIPYVQRTLPVYSGVLFVWNQFVWLASCGDKSCAHMRLQKPSLSSSNLGGKLRQLLGDCRCHILRLWFPIASFFSFQQLAIFFAVVWGGSAVVFLFSDQLGIPLYTHPLALACFFLLFFINTLNVCFRHCRFWLLKALVSTDKFVFFLFVFF